MLTLHPSTTPQWVSDRCDVTPHLFVQLVGARWRVTHFALTRDNVKYKVMSLIQL